ncbi:MAG: hypothetical protein GC178_17630 [Flavobacteriales bacterium]|nr:hypothetical protein [Flavobacteriales bacterium]
MNRTGRLHRIIDWIGLFFLLVFLTAAISSCEETCYDGKKNNGEEAVDCGGPCVKCDTSGGTCFDGIQNQGEEGVDCGGPCNACITDSSVLSPDFICTGNGGSSYFPLSLNSYWIYKMPSNQWFQLAITEQTQQNNGKDYFHMVTTGSFGTIHDYYREENGQVYRWSVSLSAEEVYIPSNPTTGMHWTTASTDSIVIDDLAAHLNSQNGCSYTDLLKITSFKTDTTGTVHTSTNYYKQGLGLVQLSSVSAYLDSAVVY